MTTHRSFTKGQTIVLSDGQRHTVLDRQPQGCNLELVKTKESIVLVNEHGEILTEYAARAPRLAIGA